jgi:hypothetical protein
VLFIDEYRFMVCICEEVEVGDLESGQQYGLGGLGQTLKALHRSVWALGSDHGLDTIKDLLRVLKALGFKCL